MGSWAAFTSLPITWYARTASSVALGDAYTGKEDVKQDGKSSTVCNISRPGGLLPFKTYQTDDSIRPKWWNGYGVDPSGSNYYHYWSEDTECLEGYSEVWEGTEWECDIQGKDDKKEEVGSIPEPSVLWLLWVGWCIRRTL